MSKNNLLFLCTGNSCRSQMAEAFGRKLWGGEFDVYSAGTQKHGMNPYAVKVMAEAGIDLSNHYSKTSQELPDIKFDVVMTVCDAAKESCPFFPGGKIIHRSFADPPALAAGLTNEDEILTIYRRIRDEIESEIKNLKDLIERS